MDDLLYRFFEVKDNYKKIFGEVKIGTVEINATPEEYIDILKKCIETNKPIEHYYHLEPHVLY